MSEIQLLQEALADWGSRLNVRMTLAGGCVRDCLMGNSPKDIDIFLLEDISGKKVEKATEDLEAVAPIAAHNYEPFLLGTWMWSGVQVQVMRPLAKTVDGLLDTFDWNVSLFAYDGSFYQREDVKNIGPGKELWIQRVTYPESTLRRGFRFSERFGMTLPRKELLRLCRLILQRERRSLPTRVMRRLVSLFKRGAK